MGRMQSFYFRRASALATIWCHMPPERVISISLSEAEWKALRSVQPEPIDWLKGKIRETIAQAQPAAPVEAAPRARTSGAH
jgi:hypothetical protein